MTWDDGEPTIGPVYTPSWRAARPGPEAGRAARAATRGIAASLQVVFEEAAAHVLALHARTRLQRLCLAGGCAMNSVMNGKIRERTPFEEVYIQPAAADNGTASVRPLRPASVARAPATFRHGARLLGPEFGKKAIHQAIASRMSDL